MNNCSYRPNHKTPVLLKYLGYGNSLLNILCVRYGRKAFILFFIVALFALICMDNYINRIWSFNIINRFMIFCGLWYIMFSPFFLVMGYTMFFRFSHPGTEKLSIMPASIRSALKVAKISGIEVDNVTKTKLPKLETFEIHMASNHKKDELSTQEQVEIANSMTKYFMGDFFYTVTPMNLEKLIDDNEIPWIIHIVKKTLIPRERALKFRPKASDYYYYLIEIPTE